MWWDVLYVKTSLKSLCLKLDIFLISGPAPIASQYSALTLLCKVWEVIQVIWQGSWSWKSVFKVYAWLLEFVASWPLHSCLSTGVDEEFCPDGSACHSGCWTAGRTLIHFPGKWFILAFCKRVQERKNTWKTHKFNVWQAALLCLVMLTITDS